MIFIGSYNNFLHQHVWSLFPKVPKVLLNDGTGLIAIAQQRLQGNLNARSSRGLIKALGFKNETIKGLIFFCPYFLTLREGDNLAYLEEEHYIKEIKEKLVYFIGSPLIEHSIITEAFFFKALEKTRSKYSDYTIVYFKHRQESEGTVSKIRQIFEVRELPLPFEEFIVSERYFPEVIISFYSSALVNSISILKGIQFVSIKLNDKTIIREEIRENIYTVYDYIERVSKEKDNVRLINLS